jgi:omega-6 fatty acid desaturase (delta-12 desaturase)
MSDEVLVYRHINKYANSSDIQAWSYLLPTFALYIGGFYLPLWTFPLHALCFLRMFICMHDMGHGHFFKTKSLNVALGYISSTLVFTPFTYWVNGHNFHHKHSNDLKHTQISQSAPFTVKEYTSWPSLYKRAYTTVTHPVLFLSILSPTYLALYNPLIPSTLGEKLIFSVYLYFLWTTGNLVHFLCSGVVAASFGAFLFHLQHTYEGAKRYEGITHFDSAMKGASFLQVPWFLQWATGSIEYHHIHHLSVGVPLYNLKACHEDAPELFDSVKRISLLEGLDSLKFILYDEDKNSFVTQKQL